MLEDFCGYFKCICDPLRTTPWISMTTILSNLRHVSSAVSVLVLSKKSATHFLYHEKGTCSSRSQK